LSQFNKPKRKRRAKITPKKPGVPVLQEQLIRINVKELLLNQKGLLEFLVPNLIRLRQMVVVVLMPIEVKTFVKEIDLLL
jgi:hypothetical protein